MNKLKLNFKILNNLGLDKGGIRYKRYIVVSINLNIILVIIN